MLSGVGSAGDGQWSVKRVVLQEMVSAMVSGAGSAGDGQCNGQWSEQCWRWSMQWSVERAVPEMVNAMFSGAGSAGDGQCNGQWSGQCWSTILSHWSLERPELEMVTGHLI